jgi:CDP-diacylglycerol--serine O-phosphatidyltransferase
MLTLGNLVCGFYAIVHVGAVDWVDGRPVPWDSFWYASVAIMLAMVFDMLDGRIARMTNSTSDFGAQLDSLADAVTFGVAPGVLVAMLHAMGRYGEGAFYSKVAWVFGAAYACAAVIRLARFNVDTEGHEEEAHLDFKGLPSPAAAGVIATLVLLYYFLTGDRASTRLAWIEPNVVGVFAQRLLDALPFVALGVGYLMVSPFKYAHVANRFLKGRKPVDYLTGIIFAGVLVALFPEVCAAVIFCGFALSGPVLAFRAWMRGPATKPAAEAPKAAPPPTTHAPPADPGASANPTATPTAEDSSTDAAPPSPAAADDAQPSAST